jgi:hypothetical protein
MNIDLRNNDTWFRGKHLDVVFSQRSSNALCLVYVQGADSIQDIPHILCIFTY